MDKNLIITYELLKQLRINRVSIAFGYMMSCMQIVFENPECLEHITKDVYIDVAVKHNTSRYNVERSMRDVIVRAWTRPDRCEEAIKSMFGEESLKWRPTNTEFFKVLHEKVCEQRRLLDEQEGLSEELGVSEEQSLQGEQELPEE